MESEIMSDGFLENVSGNLRDQGYFIGTCLDGSLVNDKLMKNNVINEKNNKILLWQIEKLYDNYDEKKPFENIVFRYSISS